MTWHTSTGYPGGGRRLGRGYGSRLTTLRQLIPTASDMAGVLAFVAALVYLMALSFGMTRLSYDIWGALVIGPLLAGVTLPILRRLTARDDPAMVSLIMAAFVAKMVGSCARYAITFGLYDDAADAIGYHESGSRIAHAYWDGHGADVIAEEAPELVGTPFIRVLTGLLYVVTGPTMLGGFLVFGLLSFIGLYLFYRAFRIAMPEANHRRYAYLVFFLPTLLYWPSSIGKEAWITLCLGLASYGIAQILTHQVTGYPYTAFGMVGTAMIRPHITALVVAALLLAFVVRRRSWKEAAFGPIGKAVGVVALLLAGGVVLSQVATFFELEEVRSDSVDSVLEMTENRSDQGGSSFEATTPQSPADYPAALMAVLFRPYLWEAGNIQMMSAAVEGTVVLLLCLKWWRHLVRVPRLMFSKPYVAYCVAFVLMFVFAFSSISNFGIMTRQRTQVLPYMLVLLCVPAAPSAPVALTARDDVEAERTPA